MKDLFTQTKNSLFKLFSVLLLSIQALSSSAQCTEPWEDFETHRNVTYVNVDGLFTENATNPAVNYINSSTTCAKYERSTKQYDGIVGDVTVGNGDYYRDKRKVFKMDVYSAYVGMEVKITLANSTQSQLAYPTGRHSEYTALTTKANQWETLTFTWLTNPDAALAGDIVNQVVIQFAGNTTANKTIYFDNFVSEYLITWDDFDFVRNATYTYKDGTLTTVTNPSANLVNSSTKCGRYIRNSGAQNDIILASVTNIGPADNYKNGYYIIKMAVYSPASGIPIKLFLNKSSITAAQPYPAGRHSYYTSTTTKANEWEILTFIYGGQPDITTPSSGVDQIAIQFAPNTSTGTTFHFDELVVVLAKPAAPSAITGPATACKNQNGIVYSVTNVSGLSYTWSVPTGATIASGIGTNSITVNYGAAAVSGAVAVKQSNAISCNAGWKGLDVTIGTGTPTVDAGTPISKCNYINFIPLNGTVGAGATGGIWSSPTGGTFTDATNLKASYTPSQADKTNGSVLLTLTTTGACSVSSATVQLTLTACTGLSVSIPSNKYCAGNTFTATYASTATYNSGNIFLVQLSNASGSFSNFTNIGSITSTANSGQIACTMPAAPTPGALYRIRVVATNPSTISQDNGFDISLGYIARPDWYTNNYYIQVGQTTVLINQTSGSVSCGWVLDEGALPATPISCLQSVSYTTPGTKKVSVIAYDQYGCSATGSEQNINVYSCNPVIPSNAYIVTGTQTGGIPEDASIWVKAGASYTVTNSRQYIYVSSGGSVIMSSNASMRTVYLEPFSSFDGGTSYASGTVVYDPNAGVLNTTSSAKLIPCSNLTLATDISTDIQSNAAIDVVVYPNPTNGNFSIKSTNVIVYDVTVVNSLGQTEIHTGENISTHMKGLLIVKINTDKGITVRKINVTE
jgi:hypothetical protein